MTTTTTRRDAKTRGRAAKTARHAAKVGNGAPKAKWQPGFPGQVVLVLQGGGALGAYQIGVYEAMHEAGVEPDWVIGTSIGAINAALIAGNEPAKRFDRLREFWSRVASDGAEFDLLRFFTGLSNASSNFATMTKGIAAFFTPHLPAWLGSHIPLGVESAAYYTTAPLRETLSGLIDLEHINARHIRLTVGAVNVRSGEMRYFDSRDEIVHLDHVIASGALPPAFPAVRIDDDPYWDGGIYSNTPIEAVLDDKPRQDSVIFAVQMWNPEGPDPQTLWEVMGRQKDIQFASRARSHIARQKQIHHLRHIIREISREVARVGGRQGARLVGLQHDDARRAARRAQNRRRGSHQGHRLHAGRHPCALAGRIRGYQADARRRAMARAGRSDGRRDHP